MCSYCGCEAEAVIAELMADHAQLASLAHLARQAIAGGELGVATEQCTRIARYSPFTGRRRRASSPSFGWTRSPRRQSRS